jgi:hypothetical protein
VHIISGIGVKGWTYSVSRRKVCEGGAWPYFEIAKLTLKLDQFHYFVRCHHAESLILDDAEEVVAGFPSD